MKNGWKYVLLRQWTCRIMGEDSAKIYYFSWIDGEQEIPPNFSPKNIAALGSINVKFALHCFQETFRNS